MAYSPVQQVTASPTTGQTVNFLANSANQIAYITPAGALLALTIALPGNTVSAIGQCVTIVCTQAVTTLTISGAGSILNNVTSLLGNDCFMLQKCANDVWAQIKPL